MATEVVTTTRDCRAIDIPGGDERLIPAGSRLMITQKLGGTFTVMSDAGYLARIDGKDADALGLERPAEVASRPSADKSAEERIWDELKTVYDPEIPVNVVELGLIYRVEVSPALEDGLHNVYVQLTMTAPGCGMGDILRDEIERKIAALADVKQVDIEIVLDPPWDPSLMSESARLQLGIY